jgi:hypothetical protein
MLARSTSISVAALALGLALVFSSSAGALTRHECSEKYRAAKAAGTLGGQTWNQFRSAQCGASATTATAPVTPAAARGTGSAVFPSAVSPKYASESRGKARMHTCLDQYRANKATGANGGLKWIQKGDGYYSECVRRLKA